MPMSQSRVKILTIEVNDDYCHDAMTTAVEGGIGYWAECRNVERNEKLDILSFEVTERDREAACFPDRWVKIDPEKMKAAVTLVLTPKFEVSNGYKRMIIEDDVDAEAADILVQAAVFGEVVYG